MKAHGPQWLVHRIVNLVCDVMLGRGHQVLEPPQFHSV